MRRGTQRLAVWMVVVCVAATSCAAARDRHETRRARRPPDAPPLAVVVGATPAALDVVTSRTTTTTVPPAQGNTPPPLTFRRIVDARSPLRVGFIGDSVAYSLLPTMAATADALQRRRRLPYTAVGGFQGPGFGLTADVPGHNDIGPTAPPESYAHWRDAVARMVFVDNPDVVIVLLGIWDTIERNPGGQALRPGTPAWRQWYTMLANQFVKTLTSRGAAVIWMVMPCVGRPDLNARLQIVNDALHETWRVAPGRVAFINLSRAACKDGTPIYQVQAPEGPITVRENDGVHFRPLGAPVFLTPFLVRQFGALLGAVTVAHDDTQWRR